MTESPNPPSPDLPPVEPVTAAPPPPAPSYGTPPPAASYGITPPSYGITQAPPPGAVAAAGAGLAMKRRNPFAVWIGLPLITFGVYTYVWYYKVNKEMSEFNPRRRVDPAGPVLVLLFLWWTVIAPILSFMHTGERLRDAQTAAGLPATCSPALCWLLWFAFGTNTLYMQFELNKILDVYPQAPQGTQVPLYA